MDAQQTAQNYGAHFKILKAEWYYTEPKGQAESRWLEAAATAKAALQRLTFDEIAGLAERRSFWINIYNGAVIDRAIARGVKRTVKEVRGFFRQPFLCIAGVRLSLDDVEHGLLRDNRRHPARLLPPLLFRPRLKEWIARPFDPRLHFALNCGARSCPPIGVYAPDRIDAQLDLAATAFLDAEVEIEAANRLIRANPILRWYRSDFGDLETLVRRHRTGGLAEGPWRFRWKSYDWEL